MLSWLHIREVFTQLVSISLFSIKDSFSYLFVIRFSLMQSFSSLIMSTVQVRGKRPAHTQTARTIFAQTHVEKRVPKNTRLHSGACDN